jgi:uncharacterized delta-60 repeat protein
MMSLSSLRAISRLPWVGVVALGVALVGPSVSLSQSSDPSFGMAGHVVIQANPACQSHGCTEFGGSYAEGLLVRPNGEIVVGGSDNYIGAGVGVTGHPLGALLQLSGSGALDSAFGGSSGIESTPFPVMHIYESTGQRLIALGSAEGKTIDLAEYSREGVLDGGLGAEGILSISAPAGIVDVRRDQTGRIVALGEQEREIEVTRYLSSGRSDDSFGHAGSIRLSLGRGDTTSPVAFTLLGDGGVIVLGEVARRSAASGVKKMFVARLTPAGKLDTWFGKDGMATLPVAHTRGGVVAVAPDGNVLVATTGAYNTKPSRSEVILSDYTSAGKLVRSFGKGGVSRTLLPGVPRESVSVNAIAVDRANDPIVVGERSMVTVDVPEGVGFLTKYTSSGRDCLFGSGGTLIDSEVGGINAATTEPDGSIIVAGWSKKAFMTARYLGGSAPRTCPGEGRRFNRSR